MSEPHCAHCRQARAEHDRRISEYEMHMHLWQPSQREWLTGWHDCSICVGEYPRLCLPAAIADYVDDHDALMATWFALHNDRYSMPPKATSTPSPLSESVNP